MSTSSSISIINKNGTVQSQYCNHDGYLSYVGTTLYLHYSDILKIKELLSMGNLSSLGSVISPLSGVKHDFNNPAKDVCVFYGRDRKENNTQAKKYSSLKSFLEKIYFYEYDYIFHEKKNEWYLIDHQTKKLQKLTTLLMEEPRVSEDIKDIIRAEMKFGVLNKKLNNTLSQKDDSYPQIKIKL